MSTTIVCPADAAHPGDAETWNPSRLFDPGLFREEGAEVVFRIGGYQAHERIPVGSHVTVRGEVPITPPADRTARTVVDPSKMAVIWADHPNAVATKKDNSDTAGFRLDHTTGTVLQDLFLQGYVGIDYLGTTNALTERVGITHKIGDRWCWFQQTGAWFVHGGSTGTRFRYCMGQDTQHHTYLLHDGGWVRDTVFEYCRGILAGCGLEPDGSGRGDWTCVMDIAEQVNVDGVKVLYCTTTEGGKVGIYTEPEGTGTYDASNKNVPYVRKNILVKGCLSMDNGRYGGGFRGEMDILEGEQSNYYGGGWTIEDCLSVNGSKAGFLSRLEYNADPLIMRRCIDIGSNIGFALELAGAAGTYENCYSYQPRKIGWKLMGSGPVVLRECDVAIAEGSDAETFHLGGYTRIFDQDSFDPAHQAKVKAETAKTSWGMPNLAIGGRVAGTQCRFVIHPGTTVQTSRIDIEIVDALAAPAWLTVPETKPPVGIPETVVPPIVLPPDDWELGSVRIKQSAFLAEVTSKGRSKLIGQVPEDLLRYFPEDGVYVLKKEGA
jgi:hypothetical protein